MKRFISIACCVALVACGAEVQPEPETNIVSPVALPLPPGAIIEEPGAITRPASREFLGSLRPDQRTPQERVPHIIERGRIIVGVDQSQNLMSFSDPTSGELRGFEVELAKEIAQDIFGDPNRIEFRFVDSTDRIRALESNQVDIVVQAMTITRKRQDQVAFSTPYFTAQTRILTVTNTDIQSAKDLAGSTVCVTDQSTGLDTTRREAPESRILRVRNWSDCLVALQQNQAAAIISDDAILSGIAAQDPYTKILPQVLGEENYGVAIAKPGHRHPTDGLIRQVNFTIERIQNDNTWWAMYQRWLEPYQTTPGPPPFEYREER
ncbi:glutamate ABC transporter substrate-binding protein [Corynebacterium freiburgense]|uniref:glutamate ABC transporter substrate-binding protein n=1 Tax=Corynebacterium freiburgense TaxID=556548 RepID=UPI0003FE223A|nr:glutamate ABC transporter substrate-binding protein [Corynebacterium freiburgense]WJZ03747.1 ABC transporter glutamine-binding protein GlnH precursor [Corynebacterium freiburgense]